MILRTLAFAWMLMTFATAHPVAQGSLTLDVHASQIDARVRVSNEEVFVAGALGKEAAPTVSLEQLFQAHGEYLLRHIHLAADGKPLGGRLARVIPPEDKTTSGYAAYELTFALPEPRPHRLIVRQDVLNEIEFAPGNPWEATFVVRMNLEGRAVLENQLFTRKEPLVLAIDPGSPAAVRHSEFSAYLRHGVNHILAGRDHLLFMAALVLAAASFWELLKVVTAFTLAHTVTLTLSVLDVFRLSSRIVEPMIALSIIVVAVQNVLWPSRVHGRGRLLVAFGFGLFHGLGFAGGLLETMQGSHGVVLALAGFSIGVELGHQVVVLPIFAGIKLLGTARNQGRLRAGALRFGSGAIAVAGMVYLIAALRGSVQFP